jgi:hypothetical protein
MGLSGNKYNHPRSRLARKSSQRRQVTDSFALSLLADASGKYGEIN